MFAMTGIPMSVSYNQQEDPAIRSLTQTTQPKAILAYSILARVSINKKNASRLAIEFDTYKSW